MKEGEIRKIYLHPDKTLNKESCALKIYEIEIVKNKASTFSKEISPFNSLKKNINPVR
jgi:hypothetical protein